MERIDIREPLTKLAHQDPSAVRMRLYTFDQVFDFVSPEQEIVLDTLKKFFCSDEDNLEIIESELSQLNVDSGAIISVLAWISS